MTVIFELSKLNGSDYVQLATPDIPAGDLIKIMDKATDTDLMELPMDKFPAVLASFSKVIDAYSDVIAIALSSLQWHKEDDENEEDRT